MRQIILVSGHAARLLICVAFSAMHGSWGWNCMYGADDSAAGGSLHTSMKFSLLFFPSSTNLCPIHHLPGTLYMTRGPEKRQGCELNGHCWMEQQQVEEGEC